MVRLEEVTLEEVDEKKSFMDEEEELSGSEEEGSEGDYSDLSEEDEDEDEYDDDDDEGDDETLLERISALRDIIPPARRAAIANRWSTLYGGGAWMVSMVGKTAWVVATTALVLVIPLQIEAQKELMMKEYDEELKAQQAGASKMAGGV
ncbi:mitochondrial outer membrane translocase complex, subunit Tom22 [Piptocephalis cylindrospora]|uniref:Mitochondrial outer membrane translocase complex, subunit Tom22 n=1 Tax=Piptocephalis cylindrospora TaxID=1907219 RepID=A0A4P9Y3J1_9FUNG|nr:mitochondrial outer membrane translocase complex, subunit Tom22 [Piptocephalis cylindrospora]|eukprot:RKP12691.1 mitochondrial outer membrane translocase complex, subunit Tom22 [Piptocephalis cylindrospora]